MSPKKKATKKSAKKSKKPFCVDAGGFNKNWLTTYGLSVSQSSNDSFVSDDDRSADVSHDDEQLDDSCNNERSDDQSVDDSLSDEDSVETDLAAGAQEETIAAAGVGFVKGSFFLLEKGVMECVDEMGGLVLQEKMDALKIGSASDRQLYHFIIKSVAHCRRA